MAERGKTWTPEETLALIKIWSNPMIQSHLTGTVRNGYAFKLISERMMAKGYERTAQQCRIKVKGFKNEYKQVRDRKKLPQDGKLKYTQFYHLIQSALTTEPVKDYIVTDQMVETILKEECPDSMESRENMDEDDDSDQFDEFDRQEHYAQVLMGGKESLPVSNNNSRVQSASVQSLERVTRQSNYEDQDNMNKVSPSPIQNGCCNCNCSSRPIYVYTSPTNQKEMVFPAITKPAPDFSGIAVIDGQFKDIKLSDYKGKYLVLFFYPLDFTFVCPTEIISFSNRADDFRNIGCEVVACSTDSHFSHLAWINTPRKEGGLGSMNIPLLADKTCQIAKDYGVYKEDDGVAFRGLFIIDVSGNLRQMTINDLPVGRSVDETLRLVQAFQYTDIHGEVCPAGWKPGDATMKPDIEGSKKFFAGAH